MTRAPLYALPDEDAPLSEWCRPLSATLKTRRTNYFSDPMDSSGDHDGSGALAQKLRKLRNAKIDEDALVKMRRQGVAVATICARLGIGLGSAYRVLKRARERADA